MMSTSDEQTPHGYLGAGPGFGSIPSNKKAKSLWYLFLHCTVTGNLQKRTCLNQ